MKTKQFGHEPPVSETHVDVIEAPEGVLNVVIGRRPKGLATLRRAWRRAPKRVQ